MTRTPIIKQKEFLEIFLYIFQEKQAVPYNIEILNDYDSYDKHYGIYEYMKSKKYYSNLDKNAFGKKLLRFKKLGFIDLLQHPLQRKGKQRGKISSYSINYYELISYMLLKCTPTWFVEIYKDGGRIIDKKIFISSESRVKFQSHIELEIQKYIKFRNDPIHKKINCLYDLFTYLLQTYLFKDFIK
ncbi:MAG: hypothetical protein VXZ40_04225 [Nanoarchaeota archaeon]|nr:hypothetical protein [Nanoarchaeota archaeon]